MLSLAAKRLIGVAAILAGIIVFAIGVSRPDPFAAEQSYWAVLDTTQGLGAVGRDVRLAGVNVGRIGDVEREGDDAVVELIVDEDVVVRSDARVEMRPHTLFEGSSFVDLLPGSPSAPPLEPGGRIPIEQTSNYVTIDEALRVLRPEIRESLRDLARAGARTLRGSAVRGIQRTLRSAPGLARRGRGPARALQGPRRSELRGAIAGMARTVDAVASRERELVPIARRLRRTAAGLTVDGGAPLDATLAALPGALRELRDGAPALIGLVDRLDRLAVEVTPALPELTAGVAEATPLLERSIPILRRATPLVADLRTVSERVADASPALTDLVRSLDPVATTFGESVLPVLHAPSRRGPPTYRQLLATFSAANAVFRPYQTPAQNPNGSGHLWNLGTYFENPALGPSVGATAAPATTRCADVERISAAAARRMSATGTCR